MGIKDLFGIMRKDVSTKFGDPLIYTMMRTVDVMIEKKNKTEYEKNFMKVTRTLMALDMKMRIERIDIVLEFFKKNKVGHEDEDKKYRIDKYAESLSNASKKMKVGYATFLKINRDCLIDIEEYSK